MDVVASKNGVPIRLTEERWLHITLSHEDMAGYYEEILHTIEDPEVILRGYGGALIALRNMGKERYLCVVYKELAPDDGFVVTAFFTSRINRSKKL